jgi:hypothetical protein
VQDLNAQPLLLEQVDAAYDAVLCVNGLQYLTQPEAVLTEVRGQQLSQHSQQPSQHTPQPQQRLALFLECLVHVRQL